MIWAGVFGLFCPVCSLTVHRLTQSKPGRHRITHFIQQVFIVHLLNARLRDSRKMVTFMGSYISHVQKGTCLTWSHWRRDLNSQCKEPGTCFLWGRGAAGAKTLKQQPVALGALGGQLNCRIMDDRSEVRVESSAKNCPLGYQLQEDRDLHCGALPPGSRTLLGPYTVLSKYLLNG